MNNPVIRSAGILIARIGLGIVFLAHGLQKFQQNGWTGPKTGFEMMDVPLPAVSAFVVTWLEILGGIALIAGILTPVIGALFFFDMLGAFFITHIDSGIWAADGGYELVLSLGMGALLLAVVGAGKFSVDGVLGAKVSRLLPGNKQAGNRRTDDLVGANS